ncbi:integrase arm-type DNA-binding domain-containing protein [Ancylobacter sonchi]|uniref:tyrosine-type recombinase/integrase n=1 Tax=Ancylobacter sonchi TaxID=1937790 RepID=UPI001BD3159D|nr:DUF4102 domain-containing protein [Ancylobacter sonchi]MBS7532703.1 integrase arm-type DNA-binding domain-containing protein [Ancylobacter sonchi]
MTDIAVRTAKAADKPIKLSDSGGLHLLVTPTGSELWRMAYRFDGKQKQLAFGAYPEVSLKEARTRRDQAKEKLATGDDPGVVSKLERLARKIARGNTFNHVADEYIERQIAEDRAEATVEKTKWLLSFARPLLGSRPIADISSAEALAVLQAVERRGTHERARRLRSTIGAVFRYAIATARAENDPTAALKGALRTPKVKHRAAVVEPVDIGAMLRAIDDFDGQPPPHRRLSS